MNTYRVSVQSESMNTPREFYVDAGRQSKAIQLATYGLDRGGDLKVTCSLFASRIDPRISPLNRVRAL